MAADQMVRTGAFDPIRPFDPKFKPPPWFEHANVRLSRDSTGQIVLQLNGPYRDGITHIEMQPQVFR